MKCLQCKNVLSYNLSTNRLICLSCGFNSEPDEILWKCVKCGEEFHSGAKIYNPYGCKNPMQNKDIRLKAEQTNLKNLGVKHPLQSKEIQHKWKETNLKLYGHEYNVASEHCKQKRKETNIANYGCENVFQSEQITMISPLFI